MSEALEAPVTCLQGVGPALAEKLARIGLYSVQDLVFHLPLRYQDRTRITSLGCLQPGQDAVIEGRILLADVVNGRRRSLLLRLQDGTGSISLRFYHFSSAQQQSFKRGERIRCYGEVRAGASGLEMYHPEYRLLTATESLPTEQALTPI